MPERTLRLQVVDELEVLPECESVPRLLAPDVTRGRCTLLPEIRRPARDWFQAWDGPRLGGSVPAWFERDPILPMPAVHLFRLRDAYYVPSFGVVLTSQGQVMKRSMEEAAYVTPDLSALPHAERVGAETVLDLRGLRVTSCETAIVTMPWGAIRNYGHFVLDCVAGVALLGDLAAVVGRPFVFPRLADWQRRHLALLEVEPRELDETVVHGDDLLFTSCLAHFLLSPNVSYRAAREKQLRHRAKSRVERARKIYVSRPGRTNRRFLGEGALEERLRVRGFAIVVPEQHTVDEQIEIFHAADVVVGCVGAALATVLYCRPGTRVVEIKTELTANRWVQNLCAIVGCEWRAYFGTLVEAGEPRVSGGLPRPEAGFSFDADLDDLVRFVDA